jgi:hypothetical protein
VIQDWLTGATPAPLLLRHCEVCGEKAWRPLADTVRGVTIDARLPGGKRADAILTDAQGAIELVVQLEGGSKLQNRIEPRAGLPLVVLRAATLDDEPQRWRALREHGLPAWRCRCAGTRSLPVDDDFSLRALGCPIHLRAEGDQFYARVIEDCGRCAFFVGIGYVGNDRRRIQLRCGYGAPPIERVGVVGLRPAEPFAGGNGDPPRVPISEERRPALQAPVFGANLRRQIVAGS